MGTSAENERYYGNNREYHYKRNKVRRSRIRDFFRAYKDRPCADCRVKYPYYVMDLDHTDPGKKTITPSAIATQGWGEDRIKRELEHCDVVCSNCHRERTYGASSNQ